MIPALDDASSSVRRTPSTGNEPGRKRSVARGFVRRGCAPASIQPPDDWFRKLHRVARRIAKIERASAPWPFKFGLDGDTFAQQTGAPPLDFVRRRAEADMTPPSHAVSRNGHGTGVRGLLRGF